MSTDGLVLEASREDRRIKVSVYERGGGVEGTLRPYEDRLVPWEQVEGASAEITTLLNRANKRGKVSPEIFQALKKSGQLLFDLLIPAKASEKLNATHPSTLVLHIDDKLVHIPWELLFTGREFLCRRFAMGRVVSTSQAPTALGKRSLKTPFMVLVLADPRQDLKAAYREGVEIRNLLDQAGDSFAVDFKSAPVDIAFVKKNLRDYDIVHYAGHADYDRENPSDGGWLLSDGRLKAGEISAMGGLQPMPFLVFSNACQSGQSGEWRVREGYEQQIFGLANAHLMAGVQHYVGTFWEILDEPSSYFARRFYSAVARGETVGEAVRNAREDLIVAYGEETIVWASYMLYGDPSFAFTAKDATPQTSVPVNEPRPMEVTQQLRGAGSIAMAPRQRRPWGLVLTALSLVLVGLGVWQFYPAGERETRTATTAPELAVPAVSSPDTDAVASMKSAVVGEPSPAGKTVVPSKETFTVGRPVEPSAVPPAKAAGAPPAQPKASDKSSTAARDKPTVTAALETPAFIPSKVERPPAATTPQPPATTVEQVAVKTAPPLVVAPLRLSMNIIGQRKEPNGSYTEVLVREGGVLRSRDNFQIHVEVSRPSYVYVLLYDSRGRAGQLFPDAKIDHAEFLATGRRVVIPGPDLWFWLDDETGTETIYVLASETPMEDIQGLLAKMEATDESGKRRVSDEIKVRIGAMQRGVGGITKGQAVTYSLSDGRKIQKVTDVVTGTGSVVRAVSFQHR